MAISEQSFASRLLLRIAFCWVFIIAFFEFHGGPIATIPLIGWPVHSTIEKPLDLLGQFIGIHLFHLQGRAADLHQQATGDSSISWVNALITVVLAIVVGAIWAWIIRSQQRSDQRLVRWFRLIICLELGVSMLMYGFIKVFPLQFSSPPLALLNENFGNASPTLLFWSMYGLNPTFVMAMGWIEVIAGVMLLFRKTAFAGTLSALVISANVAMLDLAFDVPVKLFSLTLVILSLLALATEMPRIAAFLLHRSHGDSGTQWAPEPATSRGRGLALTAEVLFAVLACWQQANGTWAVYRLKLEALRDPAPFTGKWIIQGKPNILSGSDTLITTIYFDPNTDMMLQDANGDMWRSRAIYNRSNHTLRVLFEAGGMGMYRVEQPDPNLLRLTPSSPESKQDGPFTLTRIPLPTDYPALHRQFHWTNEFEPLH